MRPADSRSRLYRFLTGNGGSDRFVLTNGDGPDTITDFHVAASGGDILDISDVLAGAQITSAQFTGHEADYLNFEVSGGHTIISLDLDGAGAGTDQQQVVTLQNVTTDLNTLLVTNHQIDYTP